jgi:hypothetical protein
MFDETSPDQLVHVFQILGETAFNLREGLRIRVEMMDIDVPIPEQEGTALTPARELRDEIGR